VRNIALVDAVIQLHDIARLVGEEIGVGQLHDDIRNCADRLHEFSIVDNKNSTIAQDIITKAKE
jgi:hypothetical protein